MHLRFERMLKEYFNMGCKYLGYGVWGMGYVTLLPSLNSVGSYYIRNS